MHSSRVRPLSLLALLLACVSTHAAEPKSKNKTVLDLTERSVNIEAGLPKPVNRYEYTFGSWQDKVTFLQDRGILVPYLPGDGGFGSNDRLNFGKSTAAEIHLVIGNRNESEAVSFGLVDGDGTDCSWTLPLKDKPRGAPLRFTIDLTRPDHVEKPGKTPGFDPKKTKTWQFKGNWQPAKVEVVFSRIVALAPAP